MKCPGCGSLNAYVGFSTVECSAEGCRFSLPLRIWRIEDSETHWVSARTKEHAVQVFLSWIGETAESLWGDDPPLVQLVSEEKAKSVEVRDDCDTSVIGTLWSLMGSSPELLASSVY